MNEWFINRYIVRECIYFIFTLCSCYLKTSTQILTNQSVKLGSLDQSREQQQIQLIAKDETFSFDTPTNSIQFVCCSARGKGDENNCSPDIDNIIKWMNSL